MEKLFFNKCFVFLSLTLLIGCYSDKNDITNDNLSTNKQYPTNILEDVYGISEETYNTLLHAKEKNPSYYRNLINEEVYQWYPPFGNPESEFYKQGKWIYPYLVEGLSEINKNTQGVFYPTELINNKTILVNYSDINARFIINLKRLYISKKQINLIFKDTFYSDYNNKESNIISITTGKNSHEIRKLQIELLIEYCNDNAISIYCKSELQKFIRK